jgi:hypothetical protein
MSALQEFANTVLEILVNDTWWASDTTDRIASAAIDRGLAYFDDEGMFSLKPDRDYSVVLGYPDHVAPGETYLVHVGANNPAEAIRKAKTSLAIAYDLEPEDITVIFACRGHHMDLSVAI